MAPVLGLCSRTGSAVAVRLVGDLAATIRILGAAAGPPWRKEHKLAAVAALSAGDL
jgi:hypothetical protein